VILIHDLTQAGYELRFTEDFRGMVCLSASRHGADLGHWHLGQPHASMEELTQQIRQRLAALPEESR